MKFDFKRMPQTDNELYHWVRAVWGWTIPRTPVCADHCTPFQAFADAYFVRDPIVIWKASRGFGGKTNTLGLLGNTEAVTLNAQVSILGGSGAQSTRVYEAGQEAWASPHAPNQILEASNRYITRFTTKAWIETLMASQRSVRGTHPQKLRMDEIDEMDYEILKSSLGTVMEGRRGLQTGIIPHIVMSSTHQYPDKTMSKMLGEAKEKDWPVYEWCVSRGAIVTTARGGVAIEDVRTDDLVWTRRGWKPVQHVTLMGTKQTVEVVLSSGRTLACTADHRIAVPGGWAEAGTLTASSVVLTQASAAVPPAIGADVGVGVVVGVAARAGGLRGPAVVSPMDSGVDDFKVFGVDASPDSARVVDLDSVDVETGQPHDSTMGKLLPPGLPVDDAVAVGLADSALPDQAPIVGFECSVEKVVDVRHGAIVPVYDIGVHGEHEFVANGVVVHNCYRECMNPVDGWLSDQEVETKRSIIPKAMWDAEYDLQEPSFEGRAIDTEAIELAFSELIGDTDNPLWVDTSHEDRHLLHVTGVDWAKSRDLTVATTFDASGDVWRCVEWRSFNKLPWPAQVALVETQYRKYGGFFNHDATGIGNVIADYFDAELRRRNRQRFEDTTMNGARRTALFTEYISAIEDGKIVYPRIKQAYDEHRYCTMEDLFGKGHPPDSVVAGAMAWAMRGKISKGTVALPQTFTRDTNPATLTQAT